MGVLGGNDNVQGLRFHMNPLFSDDAHEIFFLIWTIQGGMKMTSAANLVGLLWLALCLWRLIDTTFTLEKIKLSFIHLTIAIFARLVVHFNFYIALKQLCGHAIS